MALAIAIARAAIELAVLPRANRNCSGSFLARAVFLVTLVAVLFSCCVASATRALLGLGQC